MTGTLKQLTGGWLRHLQRLAQEPEGVETPCVPARERRGPQPYRAPRDVISPPSPEQQLQAPALYADLYEHAPVGYMVLDATGTIERINRPGADMLEWGRRWLLGKPFSRWVLYEDRQEIAAHLQAARTNTAPVLHEIRVKNRRGRAFVVSLQSLWITPREPGAPGFRTAMLDLSDKKRAERETRRLQWEFSQRARLSVADELAAGLAHELNQPLGTVVLNCDTALRLLRSGAPPDDEFETSLAQAAEAATRAAAIIRHLRDLLRKHEVNRTPTLLPAIVQRAVVLMQADARDHHARFVLQLAPEASAVLANPVQIEQVLVNLIRNAIEAMVEAQSEPRRITITTRAAGRHQVQLSVADLGPGMATDAIARLCGAHATTKPNGMGMGLAICRSIVEAHGGALWVEPVIGKGATLHFTLPAVEEP